VQEGARPSRSSLASSSTGDRGGGRSWVVTRRRSARPGPRRRKRGSRRARSARAQHEPVAIARGGRPEAPSGTIRARRTVNARGARRLAASWARSAPRSSRTKIGGCTPVRCCPKPARTRAP
jgi:hypothetical protein